MTAGIGHNHPADGGQLRDFLDRVRSLREEEKGIKSDIKDVFAEAKAVGYDTKMMREVLKLMDMPPEDRKEMEAILDLYKAALGMG